MSQTQLFCSVCVGFLWLIHHQMFQYIEELTPVLVIINFGVSSGNIRTGVTVQTSTCEDLYVCMEIL